MYRSVVLVSNLVHQIARFDKGLENICVLDSIASLSFFK